ncbi:DUF4982 domain-containing protein [Lutimonas halocynthiae]|uniref:DUF4982 domain-containing protein n=1 Tax=Lutimonas halocynthiae TaxID=1446477 RepID=UPI0025B2F0B4|nr:DUF4982 domain-containing protein [Lutimonas halocynthiae]MDN3643335.1 DUF4982 domain-containing protein [Lutimonas halocynthiae]
MEVRSYRIVAFVLIFMLPMLIMSQVREVKELNDHWRFEKGQNDEAYQNSFDDSSWETVSVPHDWAIYGPFDKEIDKQLVKIEQNGEEIATEKTGRTGSLPHIGQAWYRNKFSLSSEEAGKKVILSFDGAMSEAKVYINGKLVGQHNYGYSYFYFDVSDYVKEGSNTLAVQLTNRPLSSRWYPGAGLYRKVQLIMKEKESIAHWGAYITTPVVTTAKAKVNIKLKVTAEQGRMEAQLIDKNGQTVAEGEATELFLNEFDLSLAVNNPNLWSPESPDLYTAVLKFYVGDELKDEISETFGIRSISYTAKTGFSLNGESRKFKGVCLHHDLGPLGAAINEAALRRQLVILKDMGVDAIRSSHNMPSLEQLALCDEMGFMFLAESFDEWAKPKVENGYNLYFEEDAEKDVVSLVHATRNHPCIVMWSSGNEVPDQWGAEGVKRAKWLQDIFHREDPTRPVTVGMDQVEATMESGFGALMDIPGLNYRLHLYEEAYQRFPQGLLLGSETASTVSSRGVYKFPVEQGKMKQYDDGHSSSYDLECCSWSNLPDDDFVLQDDKPWVIGEFVWTGFDYLGEPTPYDEVWPSRSSYFGICDLAGIPKDRYYLYRSRWNTKEETLHVLPHWNWEGREGEKTPVFVYTSYPSAELFVNGKSMGVQKKHKATAQTRYRLMWMDVVYEPGTLKVLAYDENGKEQAVKEVHTAGKPINFSLEADRTTLSANGKDLSFITVSAVDRDGNFCPLADNDLQFKVKGHGSFKAVCNGDPTSLEMFHLPKMKLFSGKLVVLVESKLTPGEIILEVKSKGFKTQRISLYSK